VRPPHNIEQKAFAKPVIPGDDIQALTKLQRHTGSGANIFQFQMLQHAASSVTVLLFYSVFYPNAPRLRQSLPISANAAYYATTRKYPR
jgi:hypothetical protein